MICSTTRRRAIPSAVLMSMLVLAGCGAPGADGPAGSFGLDLSPPDALAASARPDGRPAGVVVFVVDGVNADIFHQMLTDGQLPAFRKYFVDRGLYVQRASVNTPSVTTANLTTLITGVVPGHHGVLAVRWFDRDRLIWRDYATLGQKNHVDKDYTAATIFERLGDTSSYSLFCQPHRGATKFFENALSAAAPFGLGFFELVDRISLYRFGEMAALARRRGEWPAVVVCYLLAPDFQAYWHGLNSPQYRNALIHTDHQIGRVMGDFERAGLLDKLVFVFTSDHGMVNVSRHFALDTFLREQCRLDVTRQRLWENTSFDDRLAVYEQDTVVFNTCGNRFASISLRRPIRRDGEVIGNEPWYVRPTMADLQAYPTEDGHMIDLPATLVAREEVFSVAYSPGPNAARVRTADGVVQFDQPDGPGGDITYRLVAGRDPLGWAGDVPDELLAGGPASPKVWRDATAGLDFADTPMQLPAFFRSRRAGDIIVFPAAEWDFSVVNRAGHGGMSAEEMHVPFMMAGPLIQPGQRLTGMSTLDLTPTILSLLGRPVPDDLDGVAIPTGAVNLQARP